MTFRSDISGTVNNDLVYNFGVTYQGSPFNLTGYTLKLIVKASATATDVSGTTYTIGSGLTWTAQVQGTFQLVIPHGSTGTAGTQWYRVDVINASAQVFTAIEGNLTYVSA